MNEPAVRVTGLRRRLGDKSVLDGVDLAVGAGELITLVGPSGCGKTTLLRVIAGLESLESGSVHLAGRDVTDVPPEKRRVGLVFQDNALFAHLRVDRNIAFGLRHLPRAQRVERVHEMIRLVKLEHLARRWPHQLSGGEQQRVALARALAPSPDVVLLDEPFGALDEVLREELGWEVKAILAQRNTGAILVTHDRHEAITLGDRVAVMDEGKILQCAAPRVAYDQPATRFVADFLAVASYVRGADGQMQLARPHQLRVAVGGQHTITRVEFLGAAHRYTIRAADGSTLVADVGPDEPLQVGAACSVFVIER
ncbi:MAG: spermidine/putrescine transporter, ATP-binding protein [Actinomycetota bacterium]